MPVIDQTVSHADRLRFAVKELKNPVWKVARKLGVDSADFAAILDGAEPSAEHARLIDKLFIEALAHQAKTKTAPKVKRDEAKLGHPASLAGAPSETPWTFARPAPAVLTSPPPAGSSPLAADFGRRVTAEQDKAGLTSIRLSEIINDAGHPMTPQRLSMIKNGSPMGRSTVQAVAQALKFSPTPYLLGCPATRSLVVVRTIVPGLWVGRSIEDRTLLAELYGTEVVEPGMAAAMIGPAEDHAIGVTWAADDPLLPVCPRIDGTDGYPDIYRELMVVWVASVVESRGCTRRYIARKAAKYYVETSLHRRDRKEIEDDLQLKTESIRNYSAQMNKAIQDINRSATAAKVADRFLRATLVPGMPVGGVKVEDFAGLVVGAKEDVKAVAQEIGTMAVLGRAKRKREGDEGDGGDDVGVDGMDGDGGDVDGIDGDGDNGLDGELDEEDESGV